MLDGADHLRNIGVLVVVPGNDLHLAGAVAQIDDHGLGGIEQGAETHANDVGGNDLIGVVAEGLGGLRLHLSVDLFLGGVALNNGVQDGGGAGGGGNTLSSADQLAVQLGDDQTDGLGSAGGVGNDVHSTRTGTTQVALALGAVQDHLVAGVGVDGAHNAGLDLPAVVQSLGHGSQAVGGAGSGGDDVVFLGQGVVVNVVNDGGQVIAGRSGNDDLLGAGVDVRLSLGLGSVETGALQNNVNHKTLTKEDNIISAASCTTNCLAPMAKALNDLAPIQSGIMCTIHAYTGDQMILDGPQRKGDLRRSRAGAVNIVPNSTGAAKAIGLVIPELNGKLIGAAQRVPTPTGSTTILNAVVAGQPTKEEINAQMKSEATESFGYNTDEIVSSDIIGMRFGSLFDATQTMVNNLDNGTSQVQVVSWYDNENSYVSQMVRTIKYFSELG